MNKKKGVRWSKRVLSITLIIAMCCGMLIAPDVKLTTTVEAADSSKYKMAIGTSDGGFRVVESGTPVEFTGTMETMKIKVMKEDGSMDVVNTSGSQSGKNVEFTWSSSYTSVLTFGTEPTPGTGRPGDMASNGEQTFEKTMIYAYKIGPGQSTIMVTFKYNDIEYTAALVLKVKLEINKSISRGTNDGDAFTSLVKTNPGTGPDSTALFFYENTADMKKEKEVTLLWQTKSTPSTVNWKSDNPNIVSVGQVGDTDPVIVKGLRAGVTRISAMAWSDDTMIDSFYAIVTPSFIKTANGVETETKEYGTATNPIVFNKSSALKTNALKTNQLEWKVTKADGTPAKDEKGRDLITLLPQENESVYIKENPRAGIYKITCQTKPAGLTMDSDLGIATAYIKIPLELITESGISMGVGDTYSIWENTTARKQEHMQVDMISGSPWYLEDPITHLPNTGAVTEPDANTGIMIAKQEGTSQIRIRLKSSIAESEYGIAPNIDPVEYKKFVTDGVKLNISVLDAFAINSKELTMTMNQVQNLVVSTMATSDITWNSSNPNIVQITSYNNANCTIKALAVGTSRVTAKQIINGVTRTAWCDVYVVKSADSIKISPNPVKMNIEELQTLTATVTPAGRVGAIDWVSSNPKVVKVDRQSGDTAIIKGVASGKATITVIYKENSIIDTCEVTVYGKMSGLKVLPEEATVNLSNKQLQLSASIAPATETLPDLIWNTSNPKIATVDNNGMVRFLTAGTVTISALVKNNPEMQGSSIIKIIKSAGGLKLEASSKVIYVGEVLKLGYTFTPSDADNQKVKWKSSNASVASVDQNGNITGASVGETTIIAQAEDGNWVDTCVISVKQKAKGIKIETKDVTLNKGDTYDIKYTIDPPNSTDISMTWATNNASIATVSNTGKITAVGVGSCIITVTTSSGEVSYCNVTVVENASGLKLNFTDKTVYVNNKFTLRATVVPDGATNRKVIWKSSNPKIATVSTKGVVKGLKVGTAIITCTSEDGGFEARCVVNVRKLVTKIKLNHTSYNLGLKKSLQLKATVTSTSATKKKVKWTSTNPGIVYVNSKGLVTGRKLGTATITAHSMDGSGVVARCKIRVVNPTSSIKLNQRNITMITGRTTTLKATVSPKNATFKTVKWTSSNSEVVSVSYDGRLTALKPGNATIKAESKDSGGAKKAYCVVIVKDELPATGVTVTTKNPTMIQGQSITMRKSVIPPLSTDRVTWSSDNTMVLTVDSSTGKVTARSAGTATVTAITDSGKIDSTTVSVVGISQRSIRMEQYSQYTLYVEGSNGAVRWSVANPNIAIVTNGMVESRKPGRTTVYATVNGVRLSCSVTVTEIGN